MTSPASIDYAHDIRPYLQLPHLLSLTWLAYPILSLVFVVFRLQLSGDSAQDAVANAKQDLLASCKAAEHAATSTASMPRYLAVVSNQQISDAVNGTMNAARATMVLALTVMEAIINFMIDIWRSTFLCFAELVIRGALSILIGGVNEINSLLTTSFNGLRTAIQDTIGGANDLLNTIKSALQALPLGAGDSLANKIQTFDIPDLSALQNVALPSDITGALQNINNSIPTVSQLKGSVESVIDTPFELLKKDINDTFAGIQFDVHALPVPSQNSVTFCDQMDTSIVDDLGRDLVKAVKIGTVLLIVLIFLLILANCALEWYKWRTMKKHFTYIREGMASDPDVAKSHSRDGRLMVGMSDHDLMSIEGTMSHPLITKGVNWLQALLRLRKSRKDKLIWFFHYVFHPPALACFIIGVFGLISVQLQLLVIGPIQAHYQQQAAASVADFSTLIATSINASMYNDSMTYANDINTRVDLVQSTINDGMFGWVNTTTTTLNTTINTFYTDVQNIVNTIFGNTILAEPVEEFVQCFLGSKVDAIESALTFLHDNLHVDIPRVNDSVLVLSPQMVNEAAQPIAQAAIGTSDSGDGTGSDGLVGRVISVYVKSLEKERIMFAIFAGLWLVVVFMALAILFWNSYGRRCCGRRSKSYDAKEPTVFYPEKMFKESSPSVEEKGEAMPLRDPPRRKNWSLHRMIAREEARGEVPPIPSREEQGQKDWDTILDHADVSAPTDAQRPKGSKVTAFISKLKKSRSRSSDNEEFVQSVSSEVNPWFAPPPETHLTDSHSAATAPRQSRAPPPGLSIQTDLVMRPLGLPELARDVPQDVSQSTRSSAQPVPMPLPLYYGYDGPTSPVSTIPANQFLRPPPFHARPKPKQVVLAVDPDASTPITRHLNTNHARKSSQAVDPFVTPFDDEHRVMNPFAAVAV
ncbi:uncharacterized protein BXZ73DRAFT_41013 [Epithele typhae]|uniref:uncharacterized protein n=1 Tax=Epithele typhae TaxID=378194 RepID=UPI0020087B6D|nr:uncharacterized protein BXZ73DRAFT_41013 [Epithele typhae]KAH9942410.1 hypothetical protein BXZ73DRAFT_41013 [Epithele typhae]